MLVTPAQPKERQQGPLGSSPKHHRVLFGGQGQALSWQGLQPKSFLADLCPCPSREAPIPEGGSWGPCRGSVAIQVSPLQFVACGSQGMTPRATGLSQGFAGGNSCSVIALQSVTGWLCCRKAILCKLCQECHKLF